MMIAVRRLLAACAVGVALLFGSSAVAALAAPTPSASPAPTKATAHPSAGKTAASEPSDNSDDLNISPDVAPDNSRMVWVLGGAVVIAIAAATIVVIRR